MKKTFIEWLKFLETYKGEWLHKYLPDHGITIHFKPLQFDPPNPPDWMEKGIKKFKEDRDNYLLNTLSLPFHQTENLILR